MVRFARQVEAPRWLLLPGRHEVGRAVPSRCGTALCLIGLMVLLLVGGGCSSDKLVGRWDCEAPMWSNLIQTYDEDGNFRWHLDPPLGNSMEIAGSWERDGDRLISQIDSAPSELSMGEGGRQVVQILPLDDATFVSKDQGGNVLRGTRREVST